MIKTSLPLTGTILTSSSSPAQQVGKLSLGCICDFPEWNHVRAGLGAVGSTRVLPGALHETYVDTPLSLMLFARLKL